MEGDEEGNERERIEKTREKPSGVSRRKRNEDVKREKEGRPAESEPFKVPRRQQRASNELIKLSNSFGLASERANKCSPLPRAPLHRSRASSA